MRAIGLALVLALLACGGPPPPEEDQDRCPGLGSAYEAARTRLPCAADTDCVAVLGIPERHLRDESIMGPRDPLTCTPATHRDSATAVEAAARAYEAAGCGDVIPISTHCGSYGHGQHITCSDAHACEVAY